MRKTSKIVQGLKKPTILNFQSLRTDRQNVNNKLVYDAIMKNDADTFKKNINENEFNKILLEFNKTGNQLLEDVKQNTLSCKLLARNISKQASRQGTKDEKLQINTCNELSKHYNIIITNLPAKTHRPLKNGGIISNEQFKNQNIKKKSR